MPWSWHLTLDPQSRNCRVPEDVFFWGKSGWRWRNSCNVTPAGHLGRSESARGDRLVWFPSVFMLENLLCELLRKNVKRPCHETTARLKFELLLRFRTSVLDSARQTRPDSGDSSLRYPSTTQIRAALHSYGSWAQGPAVSEVKQDRQTMHRVSLRRVHETTVEVGKQ